MINIRATPHRNRIQALRRSKRCAVSLAFLMAMSIAPVSVLGQGKPSLSLDQVRELLRIGAPDATIAHEIDSRGVAFQPSSALLSEVESEGAGALTLAALRKLVPAEHTICESFGGCMSGGQHAFHDKKWDDARTYFEQAATISPNSGQAWNSLGKTYLALQQTQAAYSAWDKALTSGEGVALTACIENRQPVCEGGTLRLTPTTFLRYKGDEKILSAPLSTATVVGTTRHGSPSYLTFGMHVNGTKYDFDFFPVTVDCVWTNVLVCPAEGKAEQMAMAIYFEQTIHRLASGGSEGMAIAPTVETPPQRDSPPLKILVLHRHKPNGLSFGTPESMNSYCQGSLTVYLGTVEYDCTVPDRTQGRCEHGMISPIRSVEFKGGGLRIVGRGGNWDFFGINGELRKAHDAISTTLAPQR